MIILSILQLLLSNAVTFRRTDSVLYTRVWITILLYSSLLAFSSLYMTYLDRGIALYGGLYYATSVTHIFHIFIFLTAVLMLIPIAFETNLMSDRVHSYLYDALINFDKGISVSFSFFKPYRIFRYFVRLFFFGLASDLFLHLPLDIQIYLSIVICGRLIENYDNKKYNIEGLIKEVLTNKILFITVRFFRLLGFSFLLSFLLFIFYFFGLSVDNSYILTYLEISWIRKIFIFFYF